MIYADFESILIPENNGKQNLGESYTNINFIFAAAVVLNKYMLTISLISLLRHIQAKMLFICLSLVWPKKVNIAVM